MRCRDGRDGLRAVALKSTSSSSLGPAVAVAPVADDGMKTAVQAAGGRIVSPPEADALIWTDAGDPEALRALLASSSAGWVQLPFAGIERFVEVGVIGSDRTWTCAKGVYGPATAEQALALMMTAARQIHVHVRRRSWVESEVGSAERRLTGATVLVFGAGGIGRALIRMLGPLEPRVVAVNRSGADVPGADRTIPSSALSSALPEADWVVITAPLTFETRGLFDAEMLSKLSPHAWLVNVARGGLVDTAALVGALTGGQIAGAALDVTDPEPLPDGHPLWALDNVIITPHVANTWDMALPELRALVKRNIAHFAAGEMLEGVVDPESGY